MKPTVLFFLTILFSLALTSPDTGIVEADQPFLVVAESESLSPSVLAQSDGVLLEYFSFVVLRRKNAIASDFKDLYFVNINGTEDSITLLDLLALGSVEHYEPNRFALMRISDFAANAISSMLHHSGLACGTIIKLDGDVIHPMVADPMPLIDEETKVTLVETAQQLVDADLIEAKVEMLAKIPTRYARSKSGMDVAAGLANDYLQIAAGRSDVEAFPYKHDEFEQPSLVVRITGTERPEELVILGSHIDSIVSFGGGGKAPGADDNASGTATNLEIFRALMSQNFRPKRTIEIHGYAAEELGLRGSKDLAVKYKQQGKKVITMVQHDMNLFSDTGKEKIWIVDNNTSSVLNESLIKLLNTYLNVEYETGTLYAGTSDHLSWTRQGFHAAFPFENPSDFNSHIHTLRDTTEYANLYTQAAEFAKLGVAYLVHYAGYN